MSIERHMFPNIAFTVEHDSKIKIGDQTTKKK